VDARVKPGHDEIGGFSFLIQHIKNPGEHQWFGVMDAPFGASIRAQ
jgi:hypothetical protein